MIGIHRKIDIPKSSSKSKKVSKTTVIQPTTPIKQFTVIDTIPNNSSEQKQHTKQQLEDAYHDLKGTYEDYKGKLVSILDDVDNRVFEDEPRITFGNQTFDRAKKTNATQNRQILEVTKINPTEIYLEDINHKKAQERSRIREQHQINLKKSMGNHTYQSIGNYNDSQDKSQPIHNKNTPKDKSLQIIGTEPITMIKREQNVGSYQQQLQRKYATINYSKIRQSSLSQRDVIGKPISKQKKPNNTNEHLQSFKNEHLQSLNLDESLSNQLYNIHTEQDQIYHQYNQKKSLKTPTVQFSQQKNKTQLSQMSKMAPITLTQSKKKTTKVNTFLQSQRKKVQDQKKKTIYISEQVSAVISGQSPSHLNYQRDSEQQMKTSLKLEPFSDYQKDFQTCLLYFFGEAIDLYCISELIKYSLKFKSYEILTKIYSYSSNKTAYELVQDELKGINIKQKIKMYNFHSLVCKMLPEFSKSQVDIVIKNIFNDKSELSYQQFGEALGSGLTDYLAQQLSNTTLNLNNNRTNQLIFRLFTTWIQLRYFQERIKNLLKSNSKQMQQFIETIAVEENISSELFVEYIKKGQSGIKTKHRKLRVEIYLNKIMGEQKTINNMIKWIFSQQ